MLGLRTDIRCDKRLTVSGLTSVNGDLNTPTFALSSHKSDGMHFNSGFIVVRSRHSAFKAGSKKAREVLASSASAARSLLSAYFRSSPGDSDTQLF